MGDLLAQHSRSAEEGEGGAFERLEAFFARFRNADGSLAGGVNEYAAPDEFQDLLRQHLGELLHRHLPPPVPGQPHPVAATVPAAYRNWLRRTLERVELLGAKEGRSVMLNSVYVPALVPPGRVSLVKYEALSPVPLLRRLDKESLYVPAPAGAGKSTFCRWAVLQSTVGTSLSHPVPARKVRRAGTGEPVRPAAAFRPAAGVLAELSTPVEF